MRHLHRLDNLIPGRYSTVLLEDLARVHAEGGNTGAVVAEIVHLESPESVPSYTKAAARFERCVLRSLHHKHYQVTSGPAFVKNLINELRRHPRDVIVPTPAAMTQLNLSDSAALKHFAGEIASAIVDETYQGRRGESRLTGEWIVYLPYEGLNFYLCLARHDEKDEFIKSRVDKAINSEWPFLRKVYE
ncbi:hypothetical protein LMG2828_01777 [Achromobacter piechaudii]|nr:hypothetical protein LMG2828_01777 [Achromobacter piechaudii]